MKNKAKRIIYNIENPGKEQLITELCRQLGIQTKKLKSTDADRKVGDVVGLKIETGKSAAGSRNAGRSGQEQKAPKDYKLPELIIFSGFSDEELDTFLDAYKHAGIEPVALKAIVTIHNMSWTIYQIASELQRERIAMMLGRR